MTLFEPMREPRGREDRVAMVIVTGRARGGGAVPHFSGMFGGPDCGVVVRSPCAHLCVCVCLCTSVCVCCARCLRVVLRNYLERP